MSRRSPSVTRARVIRRVESHLRSDSFPRLQMMLLVALTGGFGLLASFSLLRAGLDSMAFRYPLALVASYLFFLFLLWLWLRTKASDYLGAPDLSALVQPGGQPAPSVDFASGGGGDFGGGGASGSFDAPVADLDGVAHAPMKAVGAAAGSIGDTDELAIPIAAMVIAAAFAAGLALAALYAIYIAPVLFAELLVDGALSYALFRRLRSKDRPLWLASAMRRTVVPFAATAIFLAVIGAAMSAYAPEAKSIGQVIGHSKLNAAQR
jgi:hypothetical protein